MLRPNSEIETKCRHPQVIIVFSGRSWEYFWPHVFSKVNRLRYAMCKHCGHLVYREAHISEWGASVMTPKSLRAWLKGRTRM